MSRAKILVVDDEFSIRTLVGRYLEREGYKVSLAADGTSAIRLFEETQPELILLDLMLPDINGYELCTRFRQTTNVPILMLTALADDSARVRGFNAGTSEFITKPFHLRELSIRVAAMLKC